MPLMVWNHAADEYQFQPDPPTDPPPPPVDPDPPNPPEPPPAEPESVKDCLERERKPKRLGPGSELSSRRRPYGTKPN